MTERRLGVSRIPPTVVEGVQPLANSRNSLKTVLVALKRPRLELRAGVHPQSLARPGMWVTNDSLRHPMVYCVTGHLVTHGQPMPPWVICRMGMKITLDMHLGNRAPVTTLHVTAHLVIHGQLAQSLIHHANQEVDIGPLGTHL